MNTRRMAQTLIPVIGLLLASLPVEPVRGEPLGLALGAFGGLGYSPEGRVWLGGALLEAGPLEGAGVRLGAALLLPPEGTRLRMETLVLLNFRLGAWVFLGGGLAVERLATQTQFPLFAAAGLKTRPLPGVPWRFFVEGRVGTTLPREADVGPLGVQLLAGVLLSF